MAADDPCYEGVRSSERPLRTATDSETTQPRQKGMTMGNFGRIVGYWWHRWVRGVAALLMIGLCLIVALLIAAIPLYLLADLLHNPALEPGWDAVLFAVLVLMPIFLTGELRFALRDLLSQQDKENVKQGRI